MKQSILAFVMVLLLPIYSSAEVRNSLTIKNNTGQKIFLAYAWYSNAEKGWISSGWYPVLPYAEFRRDLNGLNLGSNTMYYYAEYTDKSGKKIKWEGNSEFRVEDVVASRYLMRIMQLSNPPEGSLIWPLLAKVIQGIS